MKHVLYATLFFLLPLVSWTQKNKVIAEIITYKVNLRIDDGINGEAFKDPYFVHTQMGDEWYQNKLSHIGYQHFLQIHGAASRGKITVYDPLFVLEGYRPVFQKLIPLDVTGIGNDTLYKTLQYPNPPYDDYDTSIVNLFDLRDIVQIEFMEEWKMNTKTMRIKKRLIAYALWRKRMDMQTGEFRGVSRMYWIKYRK